MKKTQKHSYAAPTNRGGLRLLELFRGGRRSFLRGFLRAVLLLGFCGVLMLVSVLTVSLSMVDTTRPMIRTPEVLEPDLQAGEYDCILVLGAGVRADGTPSPMLYDRVTAACDLYRAAGEADLPLLMSGDHTGDYNEVGVMKDLAVAFGVPSEQVFLDHKGYSTYESIYRAKHIFGVQKLVIVTQEYHLHRALHIARELGMEAVGISADLRPYRLQTRYELREMLARFKDFFAAAAEEYDGGLDPSVDLTGDGNLTN